MTYDRECELCGDVCYQELYGKREINDFIPEYQEFTPEEISNMPKDIRNKVAIVKPFKYNDNRCVCNECWEEWSKTTQTSPERGEIVKDWR